MKKVHVPTLARVAAVTLFFMSFQACQKDQAVSEISEGKQVFQNDVSTPNASQTVTIGENTLGQTKNALATRAADPEQEQLIDDDLMDSGATNTINVGDRIGKTAPSPSTADNNNAESLHNSYNVNGVIKNGYAAKERIFKVEIPDDGLYTVQMTPIDPIDLDLIVVGSKNSTIALKNDLGKFLFSDFKTGQTETVQLTKKGTYYIIVDGYNNAKGKFMLSLSHNVPLVVDPKKNANGNVYYTFGQKPCLACLQLPVKTWEIYDSYEQKKYIFDATRYNSFSFPNKADCRVTAVLTNNTKFGLTIYPTP